MSRKVYILENLGCANCAAKIEQKAAALPDVEEVSVTFATRQLRLTAEDPDALIPQIRKIAVSLEPDIVIKERSHRNSRSTSSESISEAQDTDCGCGHEHHKHHHHENCGCGHEHHKHHHHEDCSCGHEHHEHHHHEDCGCGHEHHEHHHHEDCSCKHEHHHKTTPVPTSASSKSQTIYYLENLGCANCASKMEAKINNLPGVAYASITYATRQLRLSAEDPEKLLPDIQKICTSIEPDVKVSTPDNVSAKKKAKAGTDSNHKLKQSFFRKNKVILEICFSAILFIAGKATEHNFPISSGILFITAYLILGSKVLFTAARNMLKGQIFDENFLMSIATLGAFVIGDYAEAVGVMLFYRIGEFFEEKAVEKSRGQIMNAVDMRPETVNLVTKTGTTIIEAEDAQVGDILLVRPGDRIPLDGRIVEGETRLDTSPVTGEPVPVKAGTGDEVTSGCLNTSGLIKIRVEKILEESMVTRILDSVENAAASKPRIDRFITRFSRIYTPFVVILALATAVIPSLITGDWNYWVYTALTFLVISCPCALVLSVPLAFFSGIGAGSKKGILFKGGASIEALGNIRTIVMDKTGTITRGDFTVSRILPGKDMTENKLLSLAASCELNSTHPIGNSIVMAAKENRLTISQPLSVEEIAGCGIKAVLPEGTVLCGNQKLMDRFQVSLNGRKTAGYGTEVLVALNNNYIGRLTISDTLKEDAIPAISRIKQMGISTVMLTGDAKDSADAVAKESGIDQVYAKLLPQDKLEKLSDIRKQHGAVMFVGDGINDAPVLAGADVGAAMGSGADAAIEAADVVFMTSSVSAIPQSVTIARQTSRIAWQNVAIALAVKLIVMIFGLIGFASMWMAVFADTGVSIICILNSIRILYKK